ncbi:MAG: autotransporter-associated beta strand repeat-containing protein, partial [Phycisphaeraceae bacterium]
MSRAEKTMLRFGGRMAAVVALGTVIAAMGGRAMADTMVWDGVTNDATPSGNAKWTNALNWVGDTLPAAGDDLSFWTSSNSGQTIDLDGDQTAASLTFTSTTQDMSLGLVNTTNVLTLNGNITKNPSSYGVYLNSAISLGANSTWSVAGSSGRELYAQGAITSNNYSITQTGAGRRLILNAASPNYTTEWVIKEGILQPQAAGALGSGAVRFDATAAAEAQLAFNVVNSAGYESETITNTIQIGGNQIIRFGIGHGQSINFNNALTGTSSGRVYLFGSRDGVMTFSGGSANTFSPSQLFVLGNMQFDKTSALGPNAFPVMSENSTWTNLVWNVDETVNKEWFFRGTSMSPMMGVTAGHTLTLGPGPSSAPALQLSNSNSATDASGVMFTPQSTGRINVTGKITDQNGVNTVAHDVAIFGAGEVKFSNTANNYRGVTSIRQGTLLLGGNAPASGAGVLGDASSAVELGEPVPTFDVTTVRAASTTFYPGGNPKTNIGRVIDGVTLNVGDRYLVKNQGFGGENGVYQVTSVTSTTLSAVRISDLDDNSEIPYGRRITITDGATQAGQSYFVATHVPGGSMANMHWAQDVVDPNLSLLTDGAFTIARNINVNANGAGTTRIGGNSAHASIFSGTVSLAKGLTVTAATGGSVDFSGDISGGGGFGVTKEGAGQVIFSAAKSYTGTTTVTDGVLAVNSTLASSNVSVTGGTLQGTGVIANSVTVGALGTLAPGNSIGDLTVGSAVIDGTFSVEVDGTGLGTADLLDVLGSFDITNAVLDLDILATL